MVYGPNRKGIMASKEYTLIIYSPNEKSMVYQILFFQVVIVMVKNKKRCTIKYIMSIKISAMQSQELHYVNKSKVTSSFQVICIASIFWLLFFYSLSMSIGKRSTLAKIWGGGCSSPSPPFSGFYGPVLYIIIKKEKQVSLSK